MNRIAGQVFKMAIERDDGSVISGNGICTQFEIEDRGAFGKRCGFVLQGVDSLLTSNSSEFANRQQVTPTDWQCSHCSSVNPVNKYECKSCGWPRGLLVNAVYEAGIWRFI